MGAVALVSPTFRHCLVHRLLQAYAGGNKHVERIYNTVNSVESFVALRNGDVLLEMFSNKTCNCHAQVS